MKLTRSIVKLENLLLDPNNPRFANISDESLSVPLQRFAEDEIQNNAFNKMMNPLFNVDSLVNSIETVGFITVDFIVAREIAGDKYVVVEGNRRTAALKHIVKKYELGQSLLSKEMISEFLNIEIVLVNNLEDEKIDSGKIIQGIRNVAGIKEWEAYQKAQFISEMIGKGKEPIAISKMIGMPIKEINRYFKTFSVMEQFKSDEEYGSKWRHSYFSYFDEVLKRPLLRSYLEWDMDSFMFKNMERLKRFFNWIIPNDEGIATFTDARDIRKLVDLVDDERALNFLDDQNLQKAINYYSQKLLRVPQITLGECLLKIDSAIDAFKNIISESFEKGMSKEDIEELSKKIENMKSQINRIKILKENEN